jgi:hypothetical protein
MTGSAGSGSSITVMVLRFTRGPNWSGIGTMSARGQARTPGKITSGNITRMADGFCHAIECEPYRECGNLEAGVEFRVETFATLAQAPIRRLPNARLLNTEADASWPSSGNLRRGRFSMSCAPKRKKLGVR